MTKVKAFVYWRRRHRGYDNGSPEIRHGELKIAWIATNPFKSSHFEMFYCFKYLPKLFTALHQAIWNLTLPLWVLSLSLFDHSLK